MKKGYIKVLDFTNEFVDQSVIQRIEEEVGMGYVIDFEGTKLLEWGVDSLAELVTKYKLDVRNLEGNSSILLDVHKEHLHQPDVSSIPEFIEMFNAKFPEKSICILDRTLDKSLEPNQNNLHVVVIEGIRHNRVYYRLYRSHLMEPIYIHQHGGFDSPELYSIENIHVTELLGQDILFRYPKDDRESLILDMLVSTR